ncbi:MAG: helix-turn-helix domain-containing protein [Clostridiales bacterium]|nr:helix-turn-helix domain-containing protein [Clostridiales bacterium]
MEISGILKNLRKESGLTQTELSEKLNIGQASIACYENGLREPQIASLIAYADFFECTIDYLVGRTDDIGNLFVGAEKSIRNEGTLSREEERLINGYRKLSQRNRAKLSGYIDGLSEN